MSIKPLPRSAFTLVELLIATAVLTGMLLILTSFVGAVNRAWISGEQQVSEFQDGRAILALISRELAQAVISPSLQFVQNPNLPSGANQRAASDSIFWLTPSQPTASGDLAEVGYYLVEDNTKSGADVYQLKRFFVPPSDATNYQIFSSPNQPSDNSAQWVTSFVTPALSNPVASGIIALWIRCLDVNGDAIPWLSGSSAGVGQLKFNSAAHFQAAIPGQPSSFQYTNTTSTPRANLLPQSVELTLVTLDAQSFKRNPHIPAQVTQANPNDISTASNSFDQQLVSNNVRTARTFTTRVRLLNAAQ